MTKITPCLPMFGEENSIVMTKVCSRAGKRLRAKKRRGGSKNDTKRHCGACLKVAFHADILRNLMGTIKGNFISFDSSTVGKGPAS